MRIVLIIFTIWLLFIIRSQAGPLDVLMSKTAAKIELYENIGLFVAGGLAMAFVVWVVNFCSRNWKTVLIICAIAATLAIIGGTLL